MLKVTDQFSKDIVVETILLMIHELFFELVWLSI
jgi:hypothetical protein